MSGHPPPSRETGQTTPTLSKECTGVSRPGHTEDGWYVAGWPADVACTLNASFGSKQGLEDQHALGGAGLFVPAQTPTIGGGFDDATDLVAQPIGFNTRQDPDAWQDRTGPVDTHNGTQGVMQPVAPALTASNDPSRSPQSSEVTQQVGAVYQAAMQVRRLTPIECERLQGFPDGYTDIQDNTPDGPRYKALGNSMAVPVMRWIGQRVQSLKETDHG